MPSLRNLEREFIEESEIDPSEPYPEDWYEDMRRRHGPEEEWDEREDESYEVTDHGDSVWPY